jgi:glucosamine-6-phosphate deaminase
MYWSRPTAIIVAVIRTEKYTEYEPYETLNLRVAEAVKNLLQQKPACCLGLPTGRTPRGVYRLLSRWGKQGEIDWSKARAYALDEYYEVDDKESFGHYLKRYLFRSTNLPADSRFSPARVDDYDALIEQGGGLDLTVLGIGMNGHIAFNEPGTPFNSWTHSVFLTESTRQANADFFKQAVPRRAVTMGIQTILSSRCIILMVSGRRKKSILMQALDGPVTPELPASFLQLHKNLQVMMDFRC